METPRDDVNFSQHPLLDDLTTEISREYIVMLERMNKGISNVLKRARGGLTKSEGLYLIQGGLTGDDLMKAAKPSGKPTKKMSEAEAAQKRKEAATSGKGAGSRGGKWYRDANGHVRYGTKPSDEGEVSRDWKPLDEEDVEKLHTSLEAVYGYHPAIRAKLSKVLQDRGVNGDLLLQVFRDANNNGFNIGEYWTELAEDAGIDPKDASDALEQVLATYRSSLEDPDFRKAAKQAIQRRKLEEQHAGEQVKRSSKYSDGKFEDLLSGNVKEEAIRVLGLMSDMELLHIPHTTREAQESFEKKVDAAKNRGNIVPNKNRLQALYSRITDMNGSQLLATYVAQMFRDMHEGKLAFHAESKPEMAATYFKDDNGDFGTEWLTEGDPGETDAKKKAAKASEIERANQLLNSEMKIALYGTDGATDKQLDKQGAQFREIANEVLDYVQAFNSDAGGQELELILTNQISPASLFKNENALKELAEKVAAKRKLVEDAVKAQANEEFETPSGMKKGLDAAGKQLLSYQKQALNWMTTMKRGILAYDTGMGKTPMSIGMISHLQDLAKAGKIPKEDARGIMVMPLGLTKQWPNEIKEYFPDAKVVVIGDDIDNVDDRIKTMEAIQNGTLEADFVILSSSVVNFHNDTRESFKNSELFDEVDGEFKPKKGVSQDEIIASLRDHAASDKMCTALRQMKGCVFFDEAHHEQQGLKKASNVRNAAAREFLKDREHSFLLTATPMPNGKPAELFELMDMIHPGSAGADVKKFENKVAVRQVDPETGEMRLMADESWGKMARDIQPYVFRKNKLDADVLKANHDAGMDLPALKGDEGEVGGATHGLVAPPSFMKLWDQAGDYKPHDFDARQEKLAPEDRQEFKRLDDIEGFGKELRIMHQQQMLSVSPKLLFGNDPKKWPEGYNGEQPKLTHMADLVKKHFQTPENADKPIVIFSQWPGSFEHATEELVKQGIDPSLIGQIHGGISADDRNATQEATNAGKIKVLFVGTQAGGAGLNLQKAANKMIFLDQPWMIAHKLQALGRVWRTGQKEDVEVINLYLKGTFDTRKIQGLEKKSATDVYASSAHLDEETMAGRAMNAFLQILGGKDSTKIEETPDSELQARIDAKGLKGLVTPQALKTPFDIKPFAKTVLYKAKLAFGKQAIETKRMLVKLKTTLGDLTPEESSRALKKLGKDEHAWVQQVNMLGKEKVALSKDAQSVIEPQPSYAPTEDKGVKMGELSPTAKAVFQAMKKNGSLTLSDFVDDHLKEHLDKEVKRDKKGKPVDPMAHLDSVKKWHDNRGDIEKEVQAGFKELEKVGAIHMTNTGTAKPDEVPLPKTPKPEAAHAAAHPDDGNPGSGINVSGGWAFDFKGGSVPKTEKFDAGKGVNLKLTEVVSRLQSMKKKPKDLEAFASEFELTVPGAKRLLKKLHEYGVIKS